MQTNEHVGVQQGSGSELIRLPKPMFPPTHYRHQLSLFCMKPEFYEGVLYLDTDLHGQAKLVAVVLLSELPLQVLSSSVSSSKWLDKREVLLFAAQLHNSNSNRYPPILVFISTCGFRFRFRFIVEGG